MVIVWLAASCWEAADSALAGALVGAVRGWLKRTPLAEMRVEIWASVTAWLGMRFELVLSAWSGFGGVVGTGTALRAAAAGRLRIWRNKPRGWFL